MSGYDILKARGVTRLCHFTKFQSLTHIISSEYGVSASDSIRSDTKNATDIERYDGELDYVCCSIEYPNSWFLQKAIQRDTNKIFNEWIVLYIDLEILNQKYAKFSPCNASKANGTYINSQIENIEIIFADTIHTFRHSRSSQMLSCCPTDGQAEILIKNNIPRDFIIGIAVGNEDIAGRAYAMQKTCSVKQISIFIAPDVLTPAWSNMIKNGNRPCERECNWSEE
ncbi:MAG: DUF4433 domain-containing protein [Fibromonadales bacterium]|nr:DUF4433 domain-containing protein [Fibromonadales bacterium]